MTAAPTFAFLVTGMGGQLSTDFVEIARPRGQTAWCRGDGIDELDITDPVAVKATVAEWCRVVREDDPAHRVVVVNAAEADHVASVLTEHGESVAVIGHLAAGEGRARVEIEGLDGTWLNA